MYRLYVQKSIHYRHAIIHYSMSDQKCSEKKCKVLKYRACWIFIFTIKRAKINSDDERYEDRRRSIVAFSLL